MSATGFARIDPAVLDRHERVAFSFSGGKDSTAVWHLLDEAGLLDRVTTYHMDTGDLLPEMRAVVAHYEARTPRFVRITGRVNEWIAEHGLPTDLLPHTAHPVAYLMGEARVPLVSRYDCCYANLMLPTFRRIIEDGNTLLIRGTKRVDMRRLPCGTGEHVDGVEIYYPIEDATNDEVFAYLRAVGAMVSPVYQHVTNSPECATCSAWWGEKRASYLKSRHPLLYARYKARMDAVAAEIEPMLGNLVAEANEPLDAPALPMALMEQATGAMPDGLRVLQANRLGKDDIAHVRELMRYMPIPRGATVLDAGCGLGEVSRILGAHRLDLSFIMVNKSEAQLAHAPSNHRFHRLVGDFHNLPLPDASVDFTMFCYALCHADHMVALREAARVTRPGGQLFVYDYERVGGDNALMEQHLFARAYRFDEVAALASRAGWALTFEAFPAGYDLFADIFGGDEELQALHRAIFSDLRPVVWRFERRP